MRKSDDYDSKNDDGEDDEAEVDGVILGARTLSQNRRWLNVTKVM